jgi:hypothetical protein
MAPVAHVMMCFGKKSICSDVQDILMTRQLNQILCGQFKYLCVSMQGKFLVVN